MSTEHLLLGLVREPDNVAARVIELLGAKIERVRAEVERSVPKGEAHATQDMTLTPRAKRVIDLAYEEARNLSNDYIGTEHLLLGLIREGDGLAGRVLNTLGVQLEDARLGVIQLQKENPGIQEPPKAESLLPPLFKEGRYDSMLYRRCGKSGLKLPAISLGAWETFGGYKDSGTARECMFWAFDRGITHFDLANNYGTPPGNAESVCGRIIKQMPRDELIVSSKAGYTMWPGPYGDWGSRKYLIASCDQSLKRMGLDYFDIFYHHRFDPETPLEESMGALKTLVDQGKALYVGISNYDGEQSRRAAEILSGYGVPLLINQQYGNMASRGFVDDLSPVAEECGFGIIAFCPLASGFLTDKYLSEEIPTDSRASQKWGEDWVKNGLTPEKREALKKLDEMARGRGQSLAQMSLAWLLSQPGVTSALIGASKIEQIQENAKAIENLSFTTEEIETIETLLPNEPRKRRGK